MNKVVRLAAFTVLFSAVSLAQALPAGTVLPVSVKSRIDAKKESAGKKFEGSVMQDVQLIDGRLIKAGARVSGHIVSANPSPSGTNLIFKFDSVDVSGQTIPLDVRLLAVASMASVSDTQVPVNAVSDLPSNQWTTRQIGGDVVFRGRGSAESTGGVKGTWLEGSSVLIQLTANPDAGCLSGPGYDRPQPVWVFSSAACGAYGFKDLSIARDAEASPGNVELDSTGNIDIRPGSGWLVIEAAPAGASTTPNRNLK